MRGVVLSNSLLVMGSSFFVGGWLWFHLPSRFPYPDPVQGASVNITWNLIPKYPKPTVRLLELGCNILMIYTVSLLCLPTFSVAIIAAFGFVNSGSSTLSMSRGVSIIFVVCFLSYNLYQKTHKHQIDNRNDEKEPGPVFNIHQWFSKWFFENLWHRDKRRQDQEQPEIADQEPERSEIADQEQTAQLGQNRSDLARMGNSNGEKEPKLGPWVAVIVLSIAAIVACFNSEPVVSSLDAISSKSGLSKEFVSLILLPLLVSAVHKAFAFLITPRGTPPSIIPPCPPV